MIAAPPAFPTRPLSNVMGLALVLIGIVLLVFGYALAGLVLLIVGVILMFTAPGSWGYYRRR